MCKNTDEDDKARKRVIIIFSFGSEGTKGNYNLGEAGLTNDENILAVITQRDIPNMPEIRHGENFRPFSFVEDFMQDDGWHSTLWVANAAEKFCLHNKLPMRADVMAAPMQLRRAIRDARRSGFEIAGAISPKMGRIWYEKISLLPWTKSWWRWWSREIPLRLLPWWLYKRLTLKT